MIAIIKYNAGNTTSVKNAIERLGFKCVVTDDERQIRSADKVIFPGVGEASSAMNYLRERQLDQLITSLTQPVLGICLGQQLLCNFSEEGNTHCLGIFEVQVKKFPATETVPHMGWNSLTKTKSPIFEGINQSNDVYFVHSYYCELSEHTIAVCDYILPFSAAMQKGNFYATQFHPEKSANVGEQILKNFLKL
ncbi:imidazole glycerol phosphate synthase subunit HisH [Riemerella anatipestifer]|uniref:imidazole glycerol phosphate synthase subunit HisH n=1 Tax=Riemerella anatipestifer TaxID=34085 RepID=UPI00129EA944|nr:imidazole glycerol phosphate synthase subunit HisH [Riemerella anatipestifer]MDY3317390.1 imidazole glycerol phosphate synthase subunit HisH [Riemerella anatipestifer]MDY3318389.1 imidazole glycerol phosphate synthase subunit HisH [Riemerella anatipestifer]MDY3324658.1 imidazole glycerol phosphate synthase subunit HisH [Riemerella anatipestifer]MDY3353468.1 imidazole glycerol phosphate synthase subunit HisH [Riemerella anatipestifer]MRM82556.1 imidazole glycerol phosphate synthase subunit H